MRDDTYYVLICQPVRATAANAIRERSRARQVGRRTHTGDGARPLDCARPAPMSGLAFFVGRILLADRRWLVVGNAD